MTIWRYRGLSRCESMKMLLLLLLVGVCVCVCVCVGGGGGRGERCALVLPACCDANVMMPKIMELSARPIPATPYPPLKTRNRKSPLDSSRPGPSRYVRSDGSEQSFLGGAVIRNLTQDLSSVQFRVYCLKVGFSDRSCDIRVPWLPWPQ